MNSLICNKKILLTIIVSMICCGSTLYGKDKKSDSVFNIENPNYAISPKTGMSREHWIDAAMYLLDGAFSYIHTLDDPMKFPKQHDKTYPRNEKEIATEKLEGICRTLFIAAPLLRENPNLILNNIKVADYYRYQILNLINRDSPSFIAPRTGKGPNQILVEFGALAISMSMIPDIIWEPLTKEQKDKLAATMLSYGDGPTVNSNWKFFNIFVLSFFKDQGYLVNEALMKKYLNEALDFYRGDGWYNDNPAYDYYSMWAFQMYGPLWSELYGKRFYPDIAERFMNNLKEMAMNYPYMFNQQGKMNMWGRSIGYRFAAVSPLAFLGYLNDSTINYGWMRRIASSTLLQFLQHPNFLQDRVPTLGFYGPFEPATQIYSCRGSVYWSGKIFLALFIPLNNPFWTAIENNGAWDTELKKGMVYNKFQTRSELLITDYPNSGAAEIRSWCHETVAKDWQKFRSSENYNKLSYNTDFPWMADGKNGEVSMNYAVKNSTGKWEVLRLYRFKMFEDGVYYRTAVLETNNEVLFQLAEMPLPDGILRIDKVSVPFETDIRLGHYSLPELDSPIKTNSKKVGKFKAWTINNGEYELAMLPLYGWSGCEFVSATGLHPMAENCVVINATNKIEKSQIFVTLELWKKGKQKLSNKELSIIKGVSVSPDQSGVEIIFSDNTRKRILFE